VVAFEGITAGETDYSAALNTIAADAPDAVFFGGYTGEAAVFASQRGTVGLGEIPFVSGDGIYGDQFMDLAGDAAEGYYATSALPPSDSPLKADFDEKYQAAFGIPAGQLSPYSWFTYDAFNVIVDAIKKVAIKGSDGTLYIPREALIAAVRGTKGFKGVTGDVTCDASGECGSTGLAGFGVYQVTDGAWAEQEFTPEQ
jgi:branched-chain amino acid transport system substrate-binding protein